LDGRTPFTWLPDDATGCPDQGHNHPRQQREKERQEKRKKCGMGGGEEERREDNWKIEGWEKEKKTRTVVSH
jgi:hypothetical protein